MAAVLAGRPAVLHAQQPNLPVVGFLNSASAESSTHLLKAFQAGLLETGRREGRDYAITYRWLNGDRGRLKEAMADLVHRSVSVIAATGGSPAALEAKGATSSIPIVFQVGVDPVAVGLVPSLNRPGGNVTGVTILGVELGAKRVQLLRELLPSAKGFAVLVNPKSPGTQVHLRDIQAAAADLGLTVQVVNITSEAEFEPAFARLSEVRTEALLIGADALFNGLADKLAELALRSKLPAIFQFHEFVAAGGLMSYGASLTDAYQVGIYVGRILAGDSPADLPVQQSTRLEKIINLKTARALGVEVSPTMLATADEVIE
jgi:putative ABC transport system substrate-binding protein